MVGIKTFPSDENSLNFLNKSFFVRTWHIYDLSRTVLVAAVLGVIESQSTTIDKGQTYDHTIPQAYESKSSARFIFLPLSSHNGVL